MSFFTFLGNDDYLPAGAQINEINFRSHVPWARAWKAAELRERKDGVPIAMCSGRSVFVSEVWDLASFLLLS